MTENDAGEPLYRLIRKIRKPESLRELMSACLRSIYMGDPFLGEDALPPTPALLLEQVTLAELTIEGIRCAIYSPSSQAHATLPLMLYMHGGGFVVGMSEDTDYITRMLSYSNNMVVVSVNYRLAPETVFPGALDDCETVLSYLLENHVQFKIRRDAVFFGGDSAGANLAASLAYRIKLSKPQFWPKALVLLAPWLDMAVESYGEYNRLAKNGIVFDAPFIAYARASYADYSEWSNPLVSPIGISPLDMPPTIMLTGSVDPLIEQTMNFCRNALASNCTHIHSVVYEAMPHCFYSFPGLFEEEQDCYRQIAQFIAAFSTYQ